jgi:WD40 repeat protein
MEPFAELWRFDARMQLLSNRSGDPMLTRRLPINRILIIEALVIGLLAGCAQPAQKATPTMKETSATTVAATFTLPPATQAPAATDTVLPPTATNTPAAPTATQLTPEAIQNSLVISPQNAVSLQSTNQISQSGARSFSLLPGPITLALVTDQQIVLYKGTSPVETGRLDAPGTSTTTASPDGQLLASTGEDNIVHIWDTATNKEITALKGHTGAVTGLDFSPDGKILATSSYDNSIRQWDPKTGKLLSTWTFPYWPSTIQFSPDGSQLAGTELDNFTVHIWNAADGKEQRSLSWTETASPALYSAIFSPDWKTLAWTARGTVQLMDVASGKLDQTLSHEDFVSATSWSPDGQLIATASAATVNGNFSPVVVLWDVSTGKPVNTLVQSNPAVGLGFSPDGLSLATLFNEGVVSFWTVKK